MILGFSLQSILLALLSSTTILMLLRGAYQAYHGLSAEYSRSISINHLFSNDTAGIHVENDDDKVRIVASMIPLLGIYVAQKYEHPLTFRGRSLGSLLFFAVLISSVFSSE